MNLKTIILILIIAVFFLAGLSFAYCVIYAATYNVIHYWQMVGCALIPGLIVFGTLYWITNRVNDRPPKIVNLLFLMPLLIGFATGPFYLALLFANQTLDRSAVVYQATKIINKEYRSIFAPSKRLYGTKSEHAPELRVAIRLPSGEEITYLVDVDRKRFDETRQGDPVVIGIRQGGLGFAYISSIDKAKP